MDHKGLEFSEIRDLLPDIKRETLSTCLNRLVDSGIAGKRQSETNYNSWVYWMVSPSVSDGFMPVENMVSPPFSNTHETTHETEQDAYQTKVSESWFHETTPRGALDETMLVSPSVSDGFMKPRQEDLPREF
jgi:DNA-binding HxlR family transcriptional regulator